MMEKNRRNKKLILGGCTLLFVISMLFIGSQSMKKEDSFNEPDYQISFLVRGTMNNAWENMKKGADMAASDLNATINFIPMIKGMMNSPTLSQTIQDELKTKTQAIILSPNGSIKQEDINFKTPLIFAGSSRISDKQRPYIGCDNKKIASSLADDIIRHGNFNSRILIFTQKEENDSTTQILKQLQETLKKEKNDVRVQSLDKVDQHSMYSVLVKEEAHVVVALGDQQLEELANAVRKLKKERKQSVEVYGIGNSREIIAGIEDNIIMSTVIQDDFSIGYLSVRCAVDTINKKRCDSNENLRYAVIDKENMYKKENEWLLFPFVR